MGRLLAAQLALATCITDMAHAAAADTSSRPVKGEGAPAFHTRVRSEMEAVLGAPLRTHQDAINAAYLSVGWTWGADTPDELDDAAYRKAWRWGFRIEEFAQTRAERFSPEDLALAPLRASDGVQLARAARPEPLEQPSASQGWVQPAAARDDGGGDRIASVERRLLAAQQEIARITGEIDSLERRAHDPGTSTAEQASRKAELDALNRSLEDSQATLASLTGELRDVTRELAAK
jgi:hypothetical protein